MKTLYSKLILATIFLVLARPKASAQGELVFHNSFLMSGAAGSVGAVYKFPLVNSEQDALVTISDRSSSLVTLSTIDLTNTGFEKAFQPQIAYNNGSVSGAQDWWMEFTITFVDHVTSNPSVISTFSVTALDIDGDGSSLREYDAFYSPASYYILEQNSALTVSDLVVNSQPVGKTFTAPFNQYPGVDTTVTTLMTTLVYNNMNSIKVRFGANTTGSVSGANRMYSVWFKNFTYQVPLITLPVKLTSFDATYNNKNKVDLKWTTANEENAGHFVVQRSLDGVNFSDAGLVFAVGNSSQNINYNLTDDIGEVNTPVIYYRLCIVDNDGKISYSDIRIIRIAKQQDLSDINIIAYPNPVSNELRVTIPSGWQNKKVSFELFNANGQLVKRTGNASSSQTETINVSELGRGWYIVRVSCNGETAQQKIIKN